MSNSVDHFSSAIDAIAACKISRVGGAHGLGIDGDAAVTEFQTGNLAQEIYISLLPQSFDYHTHIQLKFGPSRRLEAAASAWVLCARTGAHALQAFNTIFAQDTHRQRLPQKRNAVFFCQLVFVVEGAHFFRPPAVNHVDLFRSQAAGSGDHIDGGIPGPNYSYARSNLDLIEALALGFFDKRERIAAALKLFAGNMQIFCSAQANADEQGIVVALEFSRGHIFADGDSALDLDS